MSDTKRVGFVGVGSMGQCAHLINYTDLAGCQVVAIAEVRTELGERVARRYEVPKVYADHRQMLAAESLDGIVAAQPPVGFVGRNLAYEDISPANLAAVRLQMDRPAGRQRRRALFVPVVLHDRAVNDPFVV